jgi:galactoside O-acetyltransferase
MGIRYEIDMIKRRIISLFPSSSIGILLRRSYYQKFFALGGENLNIFSDVVIESPDRIKVGKNVHINHGCIIDASDGEIEIGDNVLIGPFCVLRAANHVFSNPNVPIIEQGHEPGKIVIEDDVWLGAHVVVLPNVRIGRGSVIGAGAVVTKNIEPFSIAAGVPAKIIGNRDKK